LVPEQPSTNLIPDHYFNTQVPLSLTPGQVLQVSVFEDVLILKDATMPAESSLPSTSLHPCQLQTTLVSFKLFQPGLVYFSAQISNFSPNSSIF